MDKVGVQTHDRRLLITVKGFVYEALPVSLLLCNGILTEAFPVPHDFVATEQRSPIGQYLENSGVGQSKAKQSIVEEKGLCRAVFQD